LRQAIFIFFIAIFALPVFGEALPDAPSGRFSSSAAAYTPAVPSLNFVAVKTPGHQFFERGNNIRFAVLAGLVAADGLTTQLALSGNGSFREMNPLARPFVNQGTAGQVAASAIGLGASAGTAYLFHTTGHHKLERFMLNVSIAIEAETVSSNAWHLLH
jgi:hypothetical protein